MMEILPVAVRTTAGVVGIWGLLLVVIVTAIKAWPALRKLQLQSDTSLRADLMAMIQELRGELTDQRVKCAAEIAEIRAEHAAETATLRADNSQLHGQIHELRNQMAVYIAKERKA